MDEESDIAAIKNTLIEYAQAVNTGDFDLYMSCWADNGVQMPPDSLARVGKEQIREHMKSVFDEMNIDVTITSIDDAKVSGDLGFTRARYILTAVPKTGEEVFYAPPEGKALSLYERQSNGSWRMVYDCYNSSPPST
jgi:uncharacterized protein (TIGR02246 family)